MAAFDTGNHMSSHYRKIASAKGRIDNGTPISMVKGVRTNPLSLSKHKHRKLLTSNRGKVPDRKGDLSSSQEHEGLIDDTGTFYSDDSNGDTVHKGIGHGQQTETTQITDGLSTISDRSFKTVLESNESIDNLRHSIAKYEVDHLYNSFLLEITKDILASDIETDSEIEKIVSKHVARNIHMLREDVMLAKINALKKDIGLV